MNGVAESEMCDNCNKNPVRNEDSTLCDACAGPDWSGNCESCGASPIVPVTGMCGPCTFGEAETAGGNW